MLRRQFLFLSALAGGLSLLSSTPSRGDNHSLVDPKASIAHQLKLLQAGDVDKLKECFTLRQKNKITKELVASSQQAATHMSIDDLIKTIQMGGGEGQKTAKTTMKNGRTLTPLILTDGKWLSDTIWFK